MSTVYYRDTWYIQYIYTTKGFTILSSSWAQPKLMSSQVLEHFHYAAESYGVAFHPSLGHVSVILRANKFGYNPLDWGPMFFFEPGVSGVLGVFICRGEVLPNFQFKTNVAKMDIVGDKLLVSMNICRKLAGLWFVLFVYACATITSALQLHITFWINMKETVRWRCCDGYRLLYVVRILYFWHCSNCLII